MTASITYPADGRGAWPSSGAGGTLRTDGAGPGRYYRAAASGASVDPIGVVAATADKDWSECSIDQYAVWRATMAVQTELKSLSMFSFSIDGIWGSLTDAAVRQFQRSSGLTADGIYGPNTAKAMWKPRVVDAAATYSSEHPDLTTIVLGTVALESSWDPGAVGVDTNDLGLGQLNALAHPTMSTNDRLSPKTALPYVARLISANLKAMNFVTRDAIAAYNLGVSGANNWVSAGRPDIWKNRNVKAYIDKIWALGAAA